MKKISRSVFCALPALMVAGSAGADWFPGDPHKMHFPQLPDPNGWDVAATVAQSLADDWQCSATGPVSDIHLWGSWMEDVAGTIANVHVSIYSNVPADAQIQFSRPGDQLWSRSFGPQDFSVIDPWGTGNQGWFDPGAEEFSTQDHSLFHQINIENIQQPFEQQVGEVYWLEISVSVTGAPGGPPPSWGWKTSQNHFMDDAVWSDNPGPREWNELIDPVTGESLDLAFVITPSPGTAALLGIGGLLGTSRRRR